MVRVCVDEQTNLCLVPIVPCISALAARRQDGGETLPRLLPLFRVFLLGDHAIIALRRRCAGLDGGRGRAAQQRVCVGRERQRGKEEALLNEQGKKDGVDSQGDGQQRAGHECREKEERSDNQEETRKEKRAREEARARADWVRHILHVRVGAVRTSGHR